MSTGGPNGPGQQAYLPPPAPPKKSKAPWVVAAIGGAVLLVVAGLLVGGLLNGDDDSVDTVTATTAVPATTAPVGTVVRHDGGTFEITIPDGWEADTGESSQSTGAPGIAVAPDLAVYQGYPDNGLTQPPDGFKILDLTDLDITVEAYVAGLLPIANPACVNVDAPPEPFTVGSFTGVVQKTGPCAEGEFAAYDGRYLSVGLNGPNGEKVGVSAGAIDQATEDAIVAAIQSFSRL